MPRGVVRSPPKTREVCYGGAVRSRASVRSRTPLVKKSRSNESRRASSERRGRLAAGVCVVVLAWTARAQAEHGARRHMVWPRALPVTPAHPPAALRVPGFLGIGAGGNGAGSLSAQKHAIAASASEPRWDCRGPCTDSPRVFPIDSTLFAGVGAVGLGAGVALLLWPRAAKGPRLAPVVRLGLSTRKLGATATWRF